MSRSAWPLAALLVCTAAPASGEPPAAPPPAAEQAASPEPTPAAAEFPPYDAAGRRDPFRPFVMEPRPATEQVAFTTPLQRYELGQLRVVATIWQASPPRAMVEDNAGMGYIVGVGTTIGRSNGVVTAIEPQRIIVEERVLDYFGKEQVNRIVMATPREEGPDQAERERK